MSLRTVLACTAGLALSMPALAQAQSNREGTWETSLGVAIQNSAVDSGRKAQIIAIYYQVAAHTDSPTLHRRPGVHCRIDYHSSPCN